MHSDAEAGNTALEALKQLLKLRADVTAVLRTPPWMSGSPLFKGCLENGGGMRFVGAVAGSDAGFLRKSESYGEAQLWNSWTNHNCV